MATTFRFIVMRVPDGTHLALCLDAGCTGIGVGVLDAIQHLGTGLAGMWQLSVESGSSMMTPRVDAPTERVWQALIDGSDPSTNDLEEAEIDDPVVSAGVLRLEDLVSGRVDVAQLALTGS